MPRSGEQARERLAQAALELIGAHGFDDVTTAEIAARAGVTERTYFRHFPDKREVLFDGERQLTAWVTDALATIPPDLDTWPAMRRTIEMITEPLEGNRHAGDRLAAIVAATPALRERAASKEAHLVDLVVKLLAARGASEDEAAISARTAWAVLTHAVQAWRAAPGSRLKSHVDRSFRVLGTLVDEGG